MHNQVRITRGLIPPLQFVEFEQTNWEGNGLIETLSLRGFFANLLRVKT